MDRMRFCPECIFPLSYDFGDYVRKIQRCICGYTEMNKVKSLITHEEYVKNYPNNSDSLERVQKLNLVLYIIGVMNISQIVYLENRMIVSDEVGKVYTLCA